MPTQFSGRVTLILLVLLGALLSIFPPKTLVDHNIPFRDKVNLKPGIDMVGGVSLVYKITPPPGVSRDTGGTTLAERTMDALKRRVDPDGVRNLVWRPIGEDELEIQLPASSTANNTPVKRQALEDARKALLATNVNQSQVLAAVAMPAGAARDVALAKLAMGDPDRQKLFTSLAQMSDQLAAAKATAARLATVAPAAGVMGPQTQPAQSAADAAALDNATRVLDEVGEKFDDAKGQIEADNINPADLQAVLENQKKDPDVYGARRAAIEQRAANAPAQAAAVKSFEAAWQDYVTASNTLDDATDLKNQLRGSGVLEFHILADERSDPKVQQMFARMQPGGRGPTPQAGDTLRWYPVDDYHEFDKPGQVPQTTEWNDQHYMLAMTDPNGSMDHSQPWGLERAYPTQTETGEQAVGFSFDSNGARLFGDMTTRWQPKGQQFSRLAIVLDGKIVSAPNIDGPITGGNGIINGGSSGGFSTSDLTYLVDTLNAGSAPAQLGDVPISERRVGPTVGADNLKKGLIACAFGLVVVGIFLIGYYYVAGIVAFGAVLLNLVLILGTLAAFGATFTLPSIAGLVLTVGTAVDANVLIFERLREEQHRGLGLKMALANSYDRAFSAIIDSNMTSFITSCFLYGFGSEEVKGFGLTLIIGIIASLFTALYVTKTVFGILIDKFGLTDLGSFPLTFPKWDKLLKPNIDWMGFAWVFYSFSIVAITLGLILFGYYTRMGRMMDIEFASGTSVEFELLQPTPINDVRAMIEHGDQTVLQPGAVNVVSVEGSSEEKGRVYQVITTNQDSTRVKDAIVQAIGNKLQAQLPSKFTGVDGTLGQALASRLVFPVPAELRLWPGGAAPREATDYAGGVAIQLQGLNPPLTPADIRTRIDRVRPQVQGQEKLSNVVVVSPSGDSDATSSAFVLVSNNAMSYDPDHPKVWEQELAQPAWTLVTSAINHEAALRSVTSFNASVAGAARNAALLALTLSILVIMGYIWFRFGNFTYGTATVVALLHDTVFTLAALGFAHLLAGTLIGDWLQLEPFRINLTVVAGILTIMGYSMIDTIVVFDRIRENRGKYGHLSRQIINDAINQTLSRTLLTAGTTTITVAFMYFLGGSGIHGFTFVLLIGILVGTYSSIAIAAPILLLGHEMEQRKSTPTQFGTLSRAM